MTDDDAITQAKNLTIALRLLDSHWDRFTENMTDEQRTLLSNTISEIEPKVKNSSNISETSEEALRFFNICRQIESLALLTELEEPVVRGASLPDPDEEVKIKIINYCIQLKKKMQEELP